MLKEGIVLGHKISKSGLEVDRAKVEVIAKLPHPTSVKGVRSFLGHAGFYRRFIQDFSKIARPMTHLLEKETPFVFSEEALGHFKSLPLWTYWGTLWLPITQQKIFDSGGFIGRPPSTRISRIVKTLVLAVFHKSFTSSASFWES
ncbi:hypothetical protein Tco_1475797, partial [Tanacetum coccineum]